MPRLAVLFVALLLCACSKPAPPPEPPRPALWEVTGPQGAKGWLFGTVHSLPGNYDWQTPAIEKAAAAAGELVLELGKDEDETAIATAFTQLSRSPGHPPLGQRVPQASRATLLEWMDKAGIADAQSGEIETWAASLMIAHAIDGEKGDGVEDGLLKLASGKPVVELEGARAQLGIFDGLPEQDQRDLLLAVLAEAGEGKDKADKLAREWRRGNMKALEAETHRGLLADPELRQALLLGRNNLWASRIDARLRAGQHPFVAVGAAHMAGPDGLPALLAAKGWTVRRVQ
jgi:uncharacterized protein YbaP (TraB family)